MTDFFDSPLPEISLVGAIRSPYDLSVATARTCYSSQGIITPEQVSKDEKSRMLRDKIAASTREAGHLTTRQHAHFVFALSRISRRFIWEFLHNHPFYNSEQVSQRYVKVKGGNFTIPKFDPKDKSIYEQTLKLQMEGYEKLIGLLLPAVSSEYYRIFPNRKKTDRNEDRWEKVIQKKAYEAARYLLPVATHAYLYHTVSALTLLRYWRAAQREAASEELKYVVGRMVEEVLKSDPDFEKELSHPEATVCHPEPTCHPEPQAKDLIVIKEFSKTFDGELEKAGQKFSRLIDYPKNAEQSLARAVRSIFAKNHHELSDEQAIDLVLNPALNRSLGDTLNMMTLSGVSQALYHVHFTFQKKLSHTADSQNQRHRMTPASRPKLELHYFGEPDVVYPKLVLHVAAAKKLFDDVVEQTVYSVNDLLKKGNSFEKVHYLLPNAWAVRFQESGDLMNWHHKWKLRTCYNAQEEIFYASVEELLQVEKEFPAIARHIKAPCYLRKEAKITPYCPEGDRYCGVPVWKFPLEQYERLI